MRLSHSVVALCLLCLPLGAAAESVTGQISIGGYAESNTGSMGTATGIEFANAAGTTVSGNSGVLESYGSGTGSFAALGACASTTTGCGTIRDIGSFSNPGTIESFLTLNTPTATAVSFDLTSISNVGHATDMTGGSVTFTALGTINFLGYDPTQGQFILTAQGNNIVSFSATTLAANVPAPTPEPGSLLLLSGPAMLFVMTRMRRRR